MDSVASRVQNTFYDPRNLTRASRFLLIWTIVTVSTMLGLQIGFGWRAIFAVQMVLPWVLVVVLARYPNLFAFDGLVPSAITPYCEFGLYALVMAPLLTSEFLYVELVDSARFAWCAAGLAAAFFLASNLAVIGLERRFKPGVALLLAVVALPHGYGAALGLNTVLDRSPAAVYRARLNVKHKKGKTYEMQLTLAAWGPVSEAETVTVPYAVYKSVREGDSMCMVLRDGALGVRWHTAQSCPWTGGEIRISNTILLMRLRSPGR